MPKKKIPIYLDTSYSFEERASDLVSRMTLKEKISQMVNEAKSIPRLGIPAYNWWNECLHGVARAGFATVFPQAIGMAATFDDNLMFKVGTIISDEARAKHHEGLRNGNFPNVYVGFIDQFLNDIPNGLTFWSPNINIFRDPRWGRGQETYGEDPYLTSKFAVAFIKGLQGDDPKYLKVVATPKHYAVYNGPEKNRFTFDSKVGLKDLYETYLFAFKECVKKANAASVMAAYNKLNGVPCHLNNLLIQKLLREKWGFNGYVVSDCGALIWVRLMHRYTNSIAQAAASALKSGVDLNCGFAYNFLNLSINWGMISEKDIDIAVQRLFKARFQLGMFDPPEKVPYASIPYEVNDSQEHREMALKVARESIVLLKNQDNILPLNKNLKSVAVIGPNADSKKVLLGNYNGNPSKYTTLLEGIKNKVSKDTKIYHVKGSHIKTRSLLGIRRAKKAAKKSEVVIMCLGIGQTLEKEDMLVFPFPDRLDIALPPAQRKLLKEIHGLGKPIILVLLSGSALAVPWAANTIPAILQAWYPGEEGGSAVADVIFGDY
ncbi:MAG: glycoside hydrolase family 3 protein, partial [Promethearchaeota archaeon]